jgi:hypothetical protein
VSKHLCVEVCVKCVCLEKCLCVKASVCKRCVCVRVCVCKECVCTIWIDVKLLKMSFIFSSTMQGATRVRGGRWPTKTPPGYLWKRTCLFNPRGNFYLWQTWHGAKPRTPMQSFHKHGEGLTREPWCDDWFGLIWAYWILLGLIGLCTVSLFCLLGIFIGNLIAFFAILWFRSSWRGY